MWYQEVSSPDTPDAEPQLSIQCDRGAEDLPDFPAVWVCEINKRMAVGDLRLDGPDDEITYIFIKEDNKKEELLGGMLHKCPKDFPRLTFDDRMKDIRSISKWLY